jgi:uncharacterized protein (TIGR00725 family)
MKMKIGILGPHATTDEQYRLGVETGREIAHAGAILFCGGLDGMMRAAAQGAKSAGGQTIGILPGDAKAAANEFIDIAIPTGLGAYRNTLLVRACDAVIALHGTYGTLSEIAFALRLEVPVVGIGTWTVSRNGQPDPGIIEQLITPKTKAILLVTPSNPTGAVISPEQIEVFFDLAHAHRIALVLDETYNSFIGSPPHHLFAHKNWPENFIHIASFGKTFALTGFRCGALIAGEAFIEQTLKIQDSMVVCQPRPTQLALAFGCRQLDEWVAENAMTMKRRHDRFKEEFLAGHTGFELTASGSFFAWIKHPWSDLTGRQAAKRLVDEAHLICLPGETFGPGLEPYLRLSFGNIDDDQIPAAVQRFCV